MEMRLFNIKSAALLLCLGFSFELSAAEGHGEKSPVEAAAERVAIERKIELCKKRCNLTGTHFREKHLGEPAAGGHYDEWQLEIGKTIIDRVYHCQNTCKKPPHHCMFERYTGGPKDSTEVMPCEKAETYLIHLTGAQEGSAPPF